MKGTKRSAAVLLAFGTAFALTPMAGAQEAVTPKFSLSRTDFMPGNDFTVMIEAATCPGRAVSVTSPGFAAPVDLATLSGRFGTAPGTYTATLKCKDTTEAGTAQLHHPEAEGPAHRPVPRQGGVHARRDDPDRPGERPEVRARSELRGLHGTGAAHDQRRNDRAPATGGRGQGRQRARQLPGDDPLHQRVGGQPVHDQGRADHPPPLPGNPAPKPKPPIVKPKGAPETGGGGTA